MDLGVSLVEGKIVSVFGGSLRDKGAKGKLAKMCNVSVQLN